MITYDVLYSCEGVEKKIEFKSSYSNERGWEREILHKNIANFVKAREFGKEIIVDKIYSVSGERTQWSTGRSRTLQEIRGY